MTGAEWIEAAHQGISISITAFAVFLSLFSGYLVVAYSVGKDLSRFQVSVINVVYVLSSLITLSANFGGIRDSLIARQQAAILVPEFPAGPDTDPVTWATAILAVNFLVLVASLVFMSQIRRDGLVKSNT